MYAEIKPEHVRRLSLIPSTYYIIEPHAGGMSLPMPIEGNSLETVVKEVDQLMKENPVDRAYIRDDKRRVLLLIQPNSGWSSVFDVVEIADADPEMAAKIAANPTMADNLVKAREMVAEVEALENGCGDSCGCNGDDSGDDTFCISDLLK